MSDSLNDPMQIHSALNGCLFVKLNVLYYISAALILGPCFSFQVSDRVILSSPQPHSVNIWVSDRPNFFPPIQNSAILCVHRSELPL